MLALVVTSFVIVFLLWTIWQGLQFKLFEPLKKLPLLVHWCLCALIGGVIFTALKRFRALPHLTKWRWSHPPVWLAGVLGCIPFVYFVFGVQVIMECFKIPEFLRSLFIDYLALFLGGAVALWLKDTDNNTSVGSLTIPPKTISFDGDETQEETDFLNWIHREEPTDEDKLDMGIYAKRIAAYLIEVSPKTIGLVGDYGIGKSSILKMAKKRINAEDIPKEERGYQGAFLFCDVDGWARNKGSVAAQILDKMIETLSERVDVSSLVGVPSGYTAALQKVSFSTAQAVGTLLSVKTDPLQQLKKLDRVLAACDIRMVVFLEDLDRNTDETIIRDELPGLLSRFRSLDHVAFILAIGTKPSYGEILTRLCDYRLDLGPNVNEVRKKIRIFREWGYSLYKKHNLLNPYELRDPSNERNDWRGEFIGQKSGGDIIPLNALCELLKNPRELKLCLRNTYHCWCKLKGEVEFDMMLVIQALRVAIPGGYGALYQGRDLPRSEIEKIIDADSRRNGADKILGEAVTNEDNTDTAKSEKGHKRRCIDSLVSYLFNGKAPQSMSWTRGGRELQVDYWDRIHREDYDIGYSDQRLLKAFNEWCEFRTMSAEMLDVFADYQNKDVHDVYQFFCPLMDKFFRKLEFVDGYVKALCLIDKNPDEVAEKHEKLLIALSSVVSSMDEKTGDAKFFRNVFQQLAKKNMYLLHRWAFPSYDSPDIIMDFVSKGLDEWENDPIAFGATLTHDDFSVSSLFQAAESKKSTPLLKQFITLILSVDDEHKSAAGFQLAGLLSRHKNSLDNDDWSVLLSDTDMTKRASYFITSALDWKSRNNDKNKSALSDGQTLKIIGEEFLRWGDQG